MIFYKNIYRCFRWAVLNDIWYIIYDYPCTHINNSLLALILASSAVASHNIGLDTKVHRLDCTIVDKVEALTLVEASCKALASFEVNRMKVHYMVVA